MDSKKDFKTKYSKIEGLIAAAFSPLDNMGRLNVDIIPEYYDFLRNNNVKGVFINGTSGEAFSLTSAERNKIVDAWVDARNNAGDGSNTFKLIVQVGGTGIEDEKRLADHIKNKPIDGFSSMAPIFFKPTDRFELIKHIQQLALIAPNLPYYYYHVPQISGVDFPMLNFLDTIQESDYEIPNFAGIKFSLPNFYDYMSCQVKYGERYDMPFCSDQILICALTLGAQGSIGSTYNYSAPLSNEVIRLFQEGHVIKARNLEEKLNQLSKFLHETKAYFAIAKRLLKRKNIDLGIVRSPLMNLSMLQANEKEIMQSVDKYIEKIDVKNLLCK
ncbi:MAG: hypothetical protein GF364_00100 [Candidatus Lokiarchaeota archaeon]|nr:hypothetical protein [Candidatus Lokiarchaeota archaeon]